MIYLHASDWITRRLPPRPILLAYAAMDDVIVAESFVACSRVPESFGIGTAQASGRLQC